MHNPTTIAERLQKLMEEQGVGENELARRASVTQPTIHRILKGESKSPRISNLEKIASALGTTATYLAHGESSSTWAVAHGSRPGGLLATLGTVVSSVTEAAKSSTSAELHHYPVIAGSQASSTEELRQALSSKGKKSRCITTDYNSKDVSFWLAIEGDSMAAPVGVSPSLPEGTMVLLDSGVEPLPGKLVLAALHDGTQLTFRKLIQDSGQLYLKPLNPSYPLISIENQQDILAVAVEAKIDL